MSCGKERKYLEYQTEYTRREYMVKYKQLQQTQRRCKDSTNASRDLPAQPSLLHIWPQFSASQYSVSWCTILRDRIASSGKEHKYLEYRTEYTRREYMVKYKQLQQTQRRCKGSTNASRDLPAQYSPLHSWPQFSPVHSSASCAQKRGIE